MGKLPSWSLNLVQPPYQDGTGVVCAHSVSITKCVHTTAVPSGILFGPRRAPFFCSFFINLLSHRPFLTHNDFKQKKVFISKPQLSETRAPGARYEVHNTTRERKRNRNHQETNTPQTPSCGHFPALSSAVPHHIFAVDHLHGLGRRHLPNSLLPAQPIRDLQIIDKTRYVHIFVNLVSGVVVQKTRRRGSCGVSRGRT